MLRGNAGRAAASSCGAAEVLRAASRGLADGASAVRRGLADGASAVRWQRRAVASGAVPLRAA